MKKSGISFLTGLLGLALLCSAGRCAAPGDAPQKANPAIAVPASKEAAATQSIAGQNPAATPVQSLPVPGAGRTDLYFPLLQGKSFALVVNQTSRIGQTLLPDTLCAAGLRPRAIWAPEHGFRGQADAGAHLTDGKDPVTGLPVLSLYGKNRKPTPEMTAQLDWVVFDLQDVGCRFYTYLSTLHYVMEACAEQGVGLLLLDRPNPNDTLDGPVLKPSCQSFVGMHPIPVLHACTLGEMARMINGEGWLKDGRSCRLEIIPVDNWQHGQAYDVPVRPSPNLPNNHAIRLYPSLCLFEGTDVSVGRGTPWPFEVVGSPHINSPAVAQALQTAATEVAVIDFTPESRPGATQPMYEGQVCHGLDLRADSQTRGFSLHWLLMAFRLEGAQESFFRNARFFDLLAGTPSLRQQMLDGWDEDRIRQSWQPALEEFRQRRQAYLLYPPKHYTRQ